MNLSFEKKITKMDRIKNVPTLSYPQLHIEIKTFPHGKWYIFSMLYHGTGMQLHNVQSQDQTWRLTVKMDIISYLILSWSWY